MPYPLRAPPRRFRHRRGWRPPGAAAAIELVVADCTQAQTIDAVDLTQVHVLAVDDAAQAQTIDAVVLTQVHVLAVDDAAQAQTIDNVVLDVPTVLVVDDILQTQTVSHILLGRIREDRPRVTIRHHWRTPVRRPAWG